ncbi:basic amino acid ABC transporter substrate-binding protein [Caproiciproducens galactitolivorans]|uniref:Arginine-binding extracellular protein ArtP n=1 Tax=Caproiciproducens galactitolivorans TaxID=642589 RepID=A0A4Z0Y926_9FIRM|nr:basic amino acid ABC transporter substrate-binding protein [Caproiciproducens galactitolivorans]QEY33970.1 basic amino acid ABC transporter substrate-binding protein [Caproiciproducens galactitolivorans]TGJ76065.1 arginine-binding extracellular protein ArtP precursor [Caproiciproducens galactitolivorans]
MKKFSKLAAFLLAMALTVSMVGCTQSGTTSGTASTGAAATSVEKIKADGFVTMSTNAEFEPFEYKDADNIVGIDIDISNKIAEKLGVKLKINDVAFDSLVAELSTGKTNFVAAGMTADEDRKKNVDFSDTYFDASQSIIVLKGSPIKTRIDLNGKKVGVQQGTTGDSYCTNEKGTSDIKVASTERYNKGVDAISDLLNGKIDAVVIDDFPAKKFVEKNPDKLVKLDEALTVEKYAIAVPKGDKEMLKVVNEVLADLKSSGELDKIIDKYKAALGA